MLYLFRWEKYGSAEQYLIIMTNDKESGQYPGWDVNIEQESEEEPVDQSFLQRHVFVQLLLGGILSVAIYALLAPYLTPAVTGMFVDAGMPGFEEPTVETRVEKIPVGYAEDQMIAKFDGLPWNNSYEKYEMSITNSGSRTVEDLETTVHFPGCVVTYRQISSTESALRILGADGPTLIGKNINQPRTRDCSATLRVEELDPDESVLIEFVISSRFRRCTFLHGLDPKRRFSLNFSWEINGVLLEHTSSHFMQISEEQFNKSQNIIDNSTKAGNYGDGPSYIYGVNLTHPLEAYEVCPELNSNT